MHIQVYGKDFENGGRYGLVIDPPITHYVNDLIFISDLR